MKNFIAKQLQKMAKATMAQHAPQVVAVTGSVGKTTTRMAIAAVLGGSFVVRSPEKNYNNEFGVPLTILGEESAGKDVWHWLKVLWRSRRHGGADYPNMLVLEYGADKPGDIRALCAIAKPNVSVITAVSPVHVANYPDMHALVDEKASLGEETVGDGLVVLNADDTRVAAMASRMTTPTATYSVTRDADVRVTEIVTTVAPREKFLPGEEYARTTAKIRTRRGEATVTLVDSVGVGVVSACAAAVLVGEHYGVPVATAAMRLNARLRPAAGRLCPIAGVKGSLILDDSYNAAPASVRAGVAAIGVFFPAAKGRRIAVLGKMAELGTYATEEHVAIGQYVAEHADVFIAVGPEMRAATEAAIAAGMTRTNVSWFATPEAAGVFVDRMLGPGDVVLVKGSQSARMEKVVRAVMAEPIRAEELLVRQSAYWLAH